MPLTGNDTRFITINADHTCLHIWAAQDAKHLLTTTPTTHDRSTQGNFGLTNLGAVFTQPARGISHEGFEAEWRDIILMTVEGDQFNRSELFEESDIDAALARFEELNRPS